MGALGSGLLHGPALGMGESSPSAQLGEGCGSWAGCWGPPTPDAAHWPCWWPCGHAGGPVAVLVALWLCW